MRAKKLIKLSPSAAVPEPSSIACSAYLSCDVGLKLQLKLRVKLQAGAWNRPQHLNTKGQKEWARPRPLDFMAMLQQGLLLLRAEKQPVAIV